MGFKKIRNILYNSSIRKFRILQNSVDYSSAIQHGAESFSASQYGTDENRKGSVLFSGYMSTK